MSKVVAWITVSLVFGSVTFAAETGSIARGKELFNSTKLGTNGKSCATCHPEGKRLEEVSSLGEDQLIAIVNRCIKAPLAGTPLPPDSADMKSLVLYLKTFGK